jgi:hypothetical protein
MKPVTAGSSPRFIYMITLATFLNIEMLAAATLALWAVVRFPTIGPKSLPGAVGSLIAALALSHVAPVAIPAVAHLPYGVHLVLLIVTLPMLFAMFLAGGWLVRALIAALGGSGGGGHRVTARARP